MTRDELVADLTTLILGRTAPKAAEAVVERLEALGWRHPDEIARERSELHRLCWLQAPGRYLACDRTEGHKGRHSWEESAELQATNATVHICDAEGRRLETVHVQPGTETAVQIRPAADPYAPTERERLAALGWTVVERDFPQ